MSYEISESDIPDRQLLAIRPRSRATWTEIGEAQITHTIFGRAKVRIVRKHDHMRRALWLMAMVVAAAAAMAAWQVWLASQESAPLQVTEPAPPASANVQDNVPVTQPDGPQPAISPYAESKAQTAVVTPPITTARVPQPVQVSKDAGQSAKRVTPDPLATGGVAAGKQTDTPTRPVLPGQGVAPTVATPRPVQPAAPAAATPPAPAAREDASTAAPAVDGQAADTGKAQP